MKGTTTLIGTSLGGFEITEVIGEGGMGTVFRARQRTLQRTVALKVLRKRLLRKNRDFARRFLREARLSAQINHPNIVQVFDVGVEQGVHFIAMEHIDGSNVGLALKERGAFPVPAAVSFLAQAASGLEAARQRSLIHRDIKPDNFIATHDGVVKIMDFGLAKNSEEATKATRAGVLMGTPPYISPEQVLGKDADHRSDLYALGISLFELLTNQKPFTGESIMSVLMKHVNNPVPDVTTVRPDLPSLLVEILYRLLEKDPDHRFQTSADLLDRLDSLISADGERALAKFLFGEKPAQPVTGKPLAKLFESGPAMGNTKVTYTSVRPGEAKAPSRPSGRVISKGIIEVEPSDEDRRKYRRYLKIARDFEQAANWPRASEYFRKALGACRNEKEGKEIRTGISRVDKLKERQADTLFQRARAALEAGENPQAVSYLDAYLELKRGDASASALRKQAARTPKGLKYLGINRQRCHEYECTAARYTLIQVPAGSWDIGCRDGSKDEQPVHTVKLPSFFMGKYPVTNAQYGRFLSAMQAGPPEHLFAHPAEPPGKDYTPAFWGEERWNAANHPVVGVDWFDAWAFSAWARLGLPSEAAWEAVAGKGHHRYPWGTALPDKTLCNFFDSHEGRTNRVDKYRQGASPFGATDMAGNVQEWCADWYHRAFYSRASASAEGAVNESDTAKKVVRGGAWTSPADLCRCAKRESEYPTARQNFIGFRLALFP